MPRRTRLGIPWHIIQRGNNRTVCFYAEADYLFHLEHLDALARRFDCAIHAYVLMTNHVHLLTPQQADSASLLMKHLGQRYVQYINRSYRRSGSLWEGRFRSCLTQSEDYALGAARFQQEIEKTLGRRRTRGQAGRPKNDAKLDGGQLDLR